MPDDLKEINEKLTTLIVKSENVEKVISEMKDDRRKTSTDFWDKINNMNESINAEKFERQSADNKIITDVATTKVKVGGIVTIVSIIITSVWTFILRKVSG